MERKTVEFMDNAYELKQAKKIFKENFLGPKELQPFFEKLGKKNLILEVPQLNYAPEELEKYKNEDYILVLGIPYLEPEGMKINIRKMREIFGINPEGFEPCFYNQDWYLSEKFIDETLDLKWYLIKKNVIDTTRAQQPNEIKKEGIIMPSAILCTYVFFSYYFAYGEMLWYHDFIWCCDIDHNNDRIYVGKYNDVDGVNKNGFSIHRHLALRNCYGAVNVI